MKSFRLEILTPSRVFYQGDCLSLVLPITDGMLGIQAGHSPLSASITLGEAWYTTPNGAKIRFSVSGGMVDVSASGVSVLCEQALLPEEIDAEQQRQEAEQAKLELSRKQGYEDYLLSRLMLTNAINNLNVKKHTTVNN